MKATNFDVITTKLIARLPTACREPFHALGVIFMPITWVVILLLYAGIVRPDSVAVTLTVLIAVPLATVIKLAFRRQRPPTIYAENMRVKSYSFPSSHAYCASLGGLYFMSQALAHDLPVLAMLCGLIVVVIGVSRVYLGAHYPSDVIGGWLLGAIVVGAVLA